MKQIFQQFFKDKNGNYSICEIVVALLLLAMLVSWIAQQFFQKDVPEHMFYTFASLVAAGCFGYSIEKRAVQQ